MIKEIAFSIVGNHYSDLNVLVSNSALDTGELLNECESLILEYLKQCSTSNQPNILVVAGIPFSGKSTYIENFLNVESTRYLSISFDAIMQRLSMYQQLTRRYGLQVAFEKTELLARMVGYELLHRAVEARLPIVFEHSSTPKEHVALYRAIQNVYGYQIEMALMNVSLKVATQRANEFNGKRDDNRYTPAHYLDERHNMLQELIPAYEALMPVNRIISTTT